MSACRAIQTRPRREFGGEGRLLNPVNRPCIFDPVLTCMAAIPLAGCTHSMCGPSRSSWFPDVHDTRDATIAYAMHQPASRPSICGMSLTAPSTVIPNRALPSHRLPCLALATGPARRLILTFLVPAYASSHLTCLFAPADPDSRRSRWHFNLLPVLLDGVMMRRELPACRWEAEHLQGPVPPSTATRGSARP